MIRKKKKNIREKNYTSLYRCIQCIYDGRKEFFVKNLLTHLHLLIIMYNKTNNIRYMFPFYDHNLEYVEIEKSK